MSQTFRYVNQYGTFNIDLGTSAVRLGSEQGFTTMAMLGQVGTSQIVIDNPDGTVGYLNDQIVGWKQLYVIESAEAASNQRVFFGNTNARTYRRRVGSSLITGPANEIAVDLSDLNDLVGRYVIFDTDGNRPAETVGERMTWLIGSQYLGPGTVVDNGFVVYPAVNMDAADYTGQTVADVITDCALPVHFNFFVYFDEAAGQPSLWFDDSDTSTNWNSGITISNDLADIDNAAIENGTASVFWPMLDAELRRDPTRCYSDVFLPYAKGNVHVNSATIESNFVKRFGSAPNANVKTAAAATVVANEFLLDNATEDDVITCTIQPKAAQVNAILAGQLVQAKFTHFPGYTTPQYMRVIQRSVAQSIEDDTRYQIALVLSPATGIIVCNDPVDLNFLYGTVSQQSFTGELGPRTQFTGWTNIANVNDGNPATHGTRVAGAALGPKGTWEWFLVSDLGASALVSVMTWASQADLTTFRPTVIQYSLTTPDVGGSPETTAWIDAPFTAVGTPSTFPTLWTCTLTTPTTARYWRLGIYQVTAGAITWTGHDITTWGILGCLA